MRPVAVTIWPVKPTGNLTKRLVKRLCRADCDMVIAAAAVVMRMAAPFHVMLCRFPKVLIHYLLFVYTVAKVQIKTRKNSNLAKSTVFLCLYKQ